MRWVEEGNRSISETLITSLLPEMQGEADMITRLPGGIFDAKDARLSQYGCLDSRQ